MIRGSVRRLYLAILDRRCRAVQGNPTNARAMVFAPHPDDETIGCGGTIARKIAAGAEVHVVFMTDGSLSHSEAGTLSAIEMAMARRAEAVSACARLGIPPERLIFLDHSDGRLEAVAAEAAAQVADLFARVMPTEVFMPYVRDRHADHESTNRIVTTAMSRSSRSYVVHEYGTWFWAHWPLVSAPVARMRGHVRNVLTFVNRASWALRDMNCAIDITDALTIKKIALEQHRTQTVRLGGENWFVLSDVSDGQWLELFFRRFELFHRYTFSPPDGVARAAPPRPGE